MHCWLRFRHHTYSPFTIVNTDTPIYEKWFPMGAKAHTRTCVTCGHLDARVTGVKILGIFCTGGH